ncbi:hypothetical protein PC120_g24680 [Phytophthora cactorum]|nr:hypothetical protein PC120_g24680 [Phytophthora cactorum]
MSSVAMVGNPSSPSFSESSATSAEIHPTCVVSVTAKVDFHTKFLIRLSASSTSSCVGQACLPT